MTSPPPPPDAPDDAPLSPDEEAVLAVLDDDATPDQRRAVARDPALRRRLDEARSARAALAAPVEPPSATDLAALRARAVAAGLDTSAAPADGSPVAGGPPESRTQPSGADHDEETAGEVSAPDGADSGLPEPDASEPEGGARSSPPDELAGRRARRARRGRGARRLPPLPAVAAAALVLFVLGAALIFNDRSDDGSGDASATAADATTETAGDPNHSGDEVLRSGEEATSDADAASEGSESGRSDQDGTAAPSTTDDEPTLSYDDEEQLRRSLTAIDPATLAPPGASTPSQARVAISESAERCSVAIQSVEPAVGDVQASLLVLVDGEETLVISNPVAATEDQPASTRLTVLEPTSCLPLFAVQR